MAYRTTGASAFQLCKTTALIKTERQIRKLFTFLAFQFPFLSSTDWPEFRESLAQNKKVYFQGFIRGIDALYHRSVQDLIGPEYLNLHAEILRAIEYRNKIFHGQLTDKYLSREDLLGIVKSNREWCSLLATQSNTEFGYDGFRRNSLQKSTEPIWQRYKIQISTLDEYRQFIRKNMER